MPNRPRPQVPHRRRLRAEKSELQDDYDRLEAETERLRAERQDALGELEAERAESARLRAERDRYREALREIAEAKPRLHEDGVSVPPDFRGIARAALEGSEDMSEPSRTIRCRRCSLPSDVIPAYEADRLRAERDRYREALREAAEDLGKAANQFASIRESQKAGHNPRIQNNPERFAEKEAKARAALEGSEDDGT